ncbi:MAG: dihydropteroate synthase, partial [Muribaculaceae bacterium]|nr:dihydropteroate synthase [Muribaculaceae bacterium]
MNPFSLNINGRLVEYDRPAVMGIINATPDSFYAGSRAAGQAAVADRARLMLDQGADMLDLGAYSSRPGAGDVSEDEECRRLREALEAI